MLFVPCRNKCILTRPLQGGGSMALLEKESMKSFRVIHSPTCVFVLWKCMQRRLETAEAIF